MLVQTPRPGLHVYYRHARLEGSQTLARSVQVNQETQDSEIKKLIETRGDGGYAIVPPTPYYCHPIHEALCLPLRSNPSRSIVDNRRGAGLSV